MEPIIITKDIEKFLRLLEKIYNDIYSSILNDLIKEL